MRGPLDLRDVLAVLVHFPERALFAKILHGLGEALNGVVNFFFRREAPKREANRRVRQFSIAAERAEHVGGLEGRGRAGRPR